MQVMDKTINDHLSFDELFSKATEYLLSVDALSSIEVPYKGETLKFVKNGTFITLLPSSK